MLPHVFYLGDVQINYSGKEKQLEDLRRQKRPCDDNHTSIAKYVARQIKEIDGIAKFKKEFEPGKYSGYNIESFKKRISKLDEQLENDPRLTIDTFILREKEIYQYKEQLKNQSAQEELFNILKKHDDWLTKNHKKIKCF